MKRLIAFFLMSMPCLALSLEYQANSTDDSVIHLLKNIERKNFVQEFNFKYGSMALDTIYSNTSETDVYSLNESEKKQADFYFYSQLTIHNSENFNVAMTANFTRQDNFHIKSHTNSPSNSLNQKLYLIESKQNNHYGLVGSYLVTPSWQVSGGFIYSVPTKNAHQSNTEDNIALIGTTYSF